MALNSIGSDFGTNSEVKSCLKFSYLKELVSPKVRVIIEGFPFTSEGYTRVKNILISKLIQ